MAEPDRWSQWVLGRRADAPDILAAIRDRVLERAEPLAGATVLDVGAGDGLVGLAALERVGERGSVIFSDISQALLERAEQAVAERGLRERARFVLADASDLAEIPDRSADVVTLRSVLIYVAAKEDAFAALYRVLKPGGRVSLFEPVNRLTYPEPRTRFWGYDVSAVADLADAVKAAFAELQDPATDTMVDFDHADLARLAEEAGFAHVRCECHIDVEPGPLEGVADLDALLASAPNPLAPTVGEGIEHALGPPERERFLAHLREAHEAGRHVRRLAVAFLTARKA